MPEGDALRVNRSLTIPFDEFEWSFQTSGGPGGQHANRAATRAEVRFDIAASPSLGPRQRARLLERFGPVLRVAAGDERSQRRNREIAIERLASRLADALRVAKRRVPTKRSAAAQRRRMDDKRRRASVKRLRSRPSEE